jgi:hypothetical protein
MYEGSRLATDARSGRRRGVTSLSTRSARTDPIVKGAAMGPNDANRTTLQTLDKEFERLDSVDLKHVLIDWLVGTCDPSEITFRLAFGNGVPGRRHKLRPADDPSRKITASAACCLRMSLTSITQLPSNHTSVIFP